MAEYWDIIPSSVVPGDLHLIIRVTVASAADELRAPVLGTAYGDMQLPNKPSSVQTLNGRDVADYVLTTVTKDVQNFLVFRFAHQPTAAQARVPFRTVPTWKPYGWPMVLGKPKFEIDEGNPRVGEDGTGALYLPRGYVVYKYRNAMHCWSKVVTEQYASPTKWPENVLICTEPRPEPVEWWWYGDEQSFPACLHPKIEVPPQTRSNKRAGGADADTHLRNGRTFPPTNQEDRGVWEVNEQEFVESEGLWVRTRQIWYPPASEEQYVK